MSEGHKIQEQLDEFGQIVYKLIDVVNTARKAFMHQRGRLLIQLNNQQEPLLREISSSILKIDDLMSRKSGVEKEHYLRFHSILTHFQIIAEMTGRLEDTLRKQIKDDVLFTDRAVIQISHIFDRQTEILGCLGAIIHNGCKEIRRHTIDECKNLAQSCIEFVEDHEIRLIDGLCIPQAAPLFLAIIDQMQTVVHHEREVANLLCNDN